MSTEISNFGRLQELLPELFQTNDLAGQSYLRSRLTSDLSVLLPMGWIQESLLVNEEQVTPIPTMPNYFLGLMSSRDRVFSLIDLPKFLDLSEDKITTRRTYHTIVIRLADPKISEQEVLLGLVVDRVQGITRVNSDNILSSSSELPSQLQPYISGCFSEQQQNLPVLEMANIIKKIIQVHNN